MSSKSVISKVFFDVARCLETGSSLQLIDEQLRQQLNQAIAEAVLENSLGEKLQRPLDGGLINQDKSLVYPIYAQVPQLLREEAIPMAQLDTAKPR